MIKQLTYTALCTTFLACGAKDDAPAPAEPTSGTASDDGTPAPGDILPTTAPEALTTNCEPSHMADGGYKLSADLRPDGTATVRLTRISFRGLFPIETDFPATHATETVDGAQVLRVTGEALDLTVDIAGDRPPTDPEAFVPGRLQIKADLDWSPNDFPVGCNFRRGS